MADLALVWKDLSADCAIQGADLARDESLATAVILSLFLDAAARPDDSIPDGTTNRRGWWADTIPLDDSAAADQHGSRLWLLSREKEMPEVLRRAKYYAEEALQWLLVDGVATAVAVSATNPIRGMLALDIHITLRDGRAETFNFSSERYYAL